MQRHVIDNILTLLSVVILVDGKTRQEEVEKFCEEILDVVQESDEDLFFTKSMAKDWFRQHKAGIEQSLKFDDPKSFIRRTINSVESFADKQRLYYAMLRIAHADNEYHTSENSMISSAAERWNITKH